MAENKKGKLTMPEVKFWLAEAESCVERQKVELIQRNNYPFLINYYEGIEKTDNMHPHVSTMQRMAIINEYFPNTNELISQLMFSNPDILLEAGVPQAEKDAPIMKGAMKYCFNKTGALIENRVALFDMLYAGYCSVEVDILPKQDRDKPQTSPEMLITEPKSVFDQFKKGFKDAFSTEEAERNFALLSPPLETNYSTVQGTYIRRYDPMDVPLDWRAENVRDRRYNLKKVWMSKSEFDVKYPEFKERVRTSEFKYDYSKHTLSMHSNKVMLYEFQARLRGAQYMTIVVHPSVVDREIDSYIRPYTTNNFNMKIGTLHKYGKLYAVSMAQINRTMQDELNNYVRHMMEVAERNNPKYIADKNKVKGDALEALKNSKVNDVALVDGNTTGVVTALQPTSVSVENKELMAIFQDQKNKLWSVTESRISGRSQSEFATDMAIQEESFNERNLDIQEGLRLLIVEELDTCKDIIAKFWDDVVFFQVTGHPKMKWYEPVVVPNPNNPSEQMVLNPLSKVLTADYEVNIDIATASRPNRKQQLREMVFFMQQLVQIRQIFIDQGKDINIDEIVRISKEFGWDPDKLLIEHNPAMAPSVPTAGGETISPEENARRQAEAEARVNAGSVA